MRQEKLVAKMIDLEDRANAHTTEYLRLLSVPGAKSKASLHYLRASKLRAKIQNLIKQIAHCGPGPELPVFAGPGPSDHSSLS